ncbi:MAG: MucR family transcriptional regulator [Desulfatibacillaceae bacterium]
MAKTLAEMAAEIVAAQAAHTPMSADELSEALQKTAQALATIKKQEEVAADQPVPLNMSTEEAGELEALRANPKRSIRKNKIICLECGKEFRQLTNGHLKEHGLTTREYRIKYGFSLRQPLSAQSLTARRKRNAKERGLGEMLKEARQSKQGEGSK